MKQVTKISVTTVNSTDENRTELDINKKYCTDYFDRWKAEYKDYGRKTLYYRENPIQYQFLKNEKESQLRNISMFEQELEINNNKSRTAKDKDYHDNGVYAHLSLKELVNTINVFSIQNRISHSWMKEKARELAKIAAEKGKEFKLPKKFNHKLKGLTISKRLLSGGISSLNNSICNGSPFLFFDIDCKLHDDKEDENPELYTSNGIPNAMNKQVFEFMKSISLVTARSSSGIGICGILYVPALIGVNDNNIHMNIGKAVCNYINEKLTPPIKIKFDDNQNRFTLGRTFAVQYTNPNDKYNWNKIELNLKALEFHIETEVIEIECNSNDSFNRKEKIGSYYISDNEKYNQKYNEASIIREYNSKIKCLDLLLENGYEIAHELDSHGRIKLQKKGKNNKSVTVFSSNRFNCFTSSLDGSTAFDLLTQLTYKGDIKEAYNYVSDLYSKSNSVLLSDIEDYKLIPCDEINEHLFDYENWDRDSFYIDPLESLYSYDIYELNEILKSDFKYPCLGMNEHGEPVVYETTASDLLGVTERDIHLTIHKEYKSKGFQYPIYQLLKNDSFSKSITIKDYLTTELILKHCTSYVNQIVAGCGLGKTTCFLGKNRDKIHGLTRNKTILFVVPRTAMVLQQANSCNTTSNILASTGEKEMPVTNIEYVSSIGKNNDRLYKDRKLKSVITTYDQYVNISNHIIGDYDFVVLDESHLLASDSYKKSIPETFVKLKKIKEMNAKVKFILLSATPSVEVLTLNSYFEEDFKILNVSKHHKINPAIYIHNFRNNDRKGKDIQIFNQILSSISENKKVIIFCEDKNKMRKHWKKLEAYCNILGIDSLTKSILSSDNKRLTTYQNIVNNEEINVDVIYTTSVLNVGLNISKGTEYGVAFIFDYTTTEGHCSAESQIQLLFRNRMRNTEVHCFDSLMDSNFPDAYKINDAAKSFENLNYYFNNMKSFGTYKEQAVKDSFNYDGIKLIGQSETSECAYATMSLEKSLTYDLKRLDTFIKLAVKHECNIKYILNSDLDNANIESINDTNEFTLNVLKNLLSINEGKRIRVKNDNQSLANNITPDFVMSLESMILEGDYRVFECEYHSTYHSLVKQITRCYNTLSYYYNQNKELKDVLNFIINRQSNKTIIRKIVDYINTYKCLDSESVVSNIIIINIDKLKTITKESVETVLMTKIPNDIVSYFSNKLSKKLAGGESNYIKIANSKEFNSFFRDHIVDLVKDSFSKLYTFKKVKTSDGTRWHLIKNCILDNDSICSFEYDYIDAPILDLLGFDKENKTLDNQNLFDNLITELSKEYPNDVLKGHLISSYKPDKDYFNFPSKDSIITSMEDVFNKYQNEIIRFKELPENKRSKFAFIAIDHESGEIVIEKNLKRLHGILNENGMLNKMISHQGYNYKLYSNFQNKKKRESCLNITVFSKVPLAMH